MLDKYLKHATFLSNGQIRMPCVFKEKHTAVGAGDGSSSLFINPQINAYHCFSCGSKGTAVNLFHSLKVPIKEILRSVTISKLPTVVDKESSFRYTLNLNPPAQFLARGFSKETLKYFKVSTDIKDGKEVSVIPYESKGKIVGIKYRIERDFWTTKFNKNFLYNDDGDLEVIVTEGETDVWRAHQLGFHNCVGLLGVEFTKEQVQLLKGRTVIIATDNDLPGRVCAERLYQLLRLESKVKFLPYYGSDLGEAKEINYDSSTTYSEYVSEMGKPYKKVIDIAKKQAITRKKISW